MPLFFTPFNRNGEDLIDGGVLNPVPIAPTFGDETDVTIAVNLGGSVENPVITDGEKTEPVKDASALHTLVSHFIERFQDSVTDTKGQDWGAYDIANQAFDAMQSTIARQKLAAYPPGHTISIARNAC